MLTVQQLAIIIEPKKLERRINTETKKALQDIQNSNKKGE
jgi:hypothetical protein